MSEMTLGQTLSDIRFIERLRSFGLGRALLYGVVEWGWIVATRIFALGLLAVLK